MAVYKRGYQRYQGPCTPHLTRLLAFPRFSWRRLMEPAPGRHRPGGVPLLAAGLCAAFVYISNHTELLQGLGGGAGELPQNQRHVLPHLHGRAEPSSPSSWPRWPGRDWWRRISPTTRCPSTSAARCPAWIMCWRACSCWPVCSRWSPGFRGCCCSACRLAWRAGVGSRPIGGSGGGGRRLHDLDPVARAWWRWRVQLTCAGASSPELWCWPSSSCWRAPRS